MGMQIKSQISKKMSHTINPVELETNLMQTNKKDHSFLSRDRFRLFNFFYGYFTSINCFNFYVLSAILIQIVFFNIL